MTTEHTAPDIQIVEVSPRDGLQNEAVIVSTDAKVELIERLIGAGVQRIEAVSFASPKHVPAMADAEAVLERVPRDARVSYAGLVLNQRGLDRALATGVDEINVVVCASDTFSRRNQNVSTEDALRVAVDVTQQARSAGLFTAITIATAFGCPFEGEVPLARVIPLIRESVRAGADEVCLADTVGVGVPTQVRALADAAGEAANLQPGTLPATRFHFHNTRNTGFANAHAAIEAGVTVLDASAGGIGGCPFAPKATGNIATDDLVYLLERMGLHTGINLEALMPTADFLAEHLQHEVPALLPRAGSFP